MTIICVTPFAYHSVEQYFKCSIITGSFRIYYGCVICFSAICDSPTVAFKCVHIAVQLRDTEMDVLCAFLLLFKRLLTSLEVIGESMFT